MNGSGNVAWSLAEIGALAVGAKAADSNLLDGLDLHTGRNNEANKVVRTDVNGYIQAGWINTPSGATSSTINKIYASNDDYVRYVTPATLISQLGLWTSGNDGPGSGLNADLLDDYDYTDFNGVVARWITSGSNAAGRLKLKLPFATSSALMLKFTISQYTSYTQYDYEVAAYMYPSTNQWYLPTAVYTGTGAPDIVVGRESDGKAYVSIADALYTGVIVHSLTIGYIGTVPNAYDQGWVITQDATTPNSVSVDVRTTWNSGNDGSGSGLDADLLDGYNSSQSESGNTVAVRDPSGYLFANYFNGSGTFSTSGLTSGMARFTGTNGADTYGRSYTAQAAATLLSGSTMNISGTATNITQYTINQSVGTANSPTFANVYVADQIIHTGDTDTYMQFHAADQWRVVTGGQERLEVNNTAITTQYNFAAKTTGVDRFNVTDTDVIVQSALKEKYVALSGTTPSIDVDVGGGFSLTTSGNTTFTFTAFTTNLSCAFVLELTAGGAHTITWPASVDWAGGSAPGAPASGETNIYVFWSRNGGTTWYGVLSSAAAA